MAFAIARPTLPVARPIFRSTAPVGLRKPPPRNLRLLRGFGQDYTDVMYADQYTPSQSDLISYQGSAEPTIISDLGTPAIQPAGSVGGGGGSWLSSLLSPLISGAAQVGSAYLATQRPSGTTILPYGTTGQPTTTPIQSASLLSGKSMLPILAIVGIGGFLVLRGRKKGKR